MKKLLSILLAFMLIFPAFAEESKAESVVQMSCTVEVETAVCDGLYTGEVQNGIPHGYGLFICGQWHYVGLWQDGKMHGKGGCYWDDGSCDVGTYENGYFVCGYKRSAASQNAWINYKPNEHGCYQAIEYHANGIPYFECCINPNTGLYHMGTVYDKYGKVVFSGEIGEGFDWDLFRIE